MSRFHFDEGVADTVVASLGNVYQNMNDCINALNNISFELCDYEGFNIDYAIESIDDEKNIKFRVCTSTIETGINILNLVSERVGFYGQIANSQESIKIVNYVNENKQYNRKNNVFTKYNGETSHFTEKYCYNFGTVISQMKTSFEQTIKEGSYEKYLIKKSIKDLIAATAEDYSFSMPMNEFMEGKDDIETLMSAFNDKYKSNPFGKLYKEAKYDANIVVTLMNDYNDNMEYLNSLERSLAASGYDSKILNVVMNGIRNDFNNKYLAVAEDVLTYGFEKLVKDGIKTTTIGKAVLTTLDIMEMADQKGGNKMDYSAILNYEKDAFSAYKNLAEKIHNGNYSKQDLADYNNMFELCRNMEINKYKAAMDFVDNDDYKICQEAIKYYTNLTL